MTKLKLKNHPQLLGVVDEFKKYFKDETFGSDLEAIVADSRYKHITSNFSKAKKRIIMRWQKHSQHLTRLTGS